MTDRINALNFLKLRFLANEEIIVTHAFLVDGKPTASS